MKLSLALFLLGVVALGEAKDNGIRGVQLPQKLERQSVRGRVLQDNRERSRAINQVPCGKDGKAYSGKDGGKDGSGKDGSGKAGSGKAGRRLNHSGGGCYEYADPYDDRVDSPSSESSDESPSSIDVVPPPTFIPVAPPTFAPVAPPTFAPVVPVALPTFSPIAPPTFPPVSEPVGALTGPDDLPVDTEETSNSKDSAPEVDYDPFMKSTTNESEDAGDDSTGSEDGMSTTNESLDVDGPRIGTGEANLPVDLPAPVAEEPSNDY